MVPAMQAARALRFSQSPSETPLDIGFFEESSVTGKAPIPSWVWILAGVAVLYFLTRER